MAGPEGSNRGEPQPPETDVSLLGQVSPFGALEPSELFEIYAAILESAPDAMIVVDEDGRIVFINEQTQRLFGHERDELIGREVEELVPEPFRQNHPEYRRKYMKNPHVRGMGVGLDLSGRRKDGTQFPVEISLSPIRFDDRRYVAAAIRDATERQTAERARRLAVEQGQEIRRLEEEKRFKAHFLNMVSHELNTPITPLKLQLHLLGSRLSAGDTQAALQSLAVLDRNMSRLARLVKDVLDVSRLEAGRLRVNIQEVDLAEILEHTERSFLSPMEDPAAPAPVRVLLQIPSGQDLCVHADPDRLQQVFDNLVANAVRLSAPGSRVQIIAQAGADEVHVEVRDEGPGLSHEQIQRLFKPFSQVHDAKRDHGGTGLGLYVSHGIVDIHGGRMSATSDGPGRGAVFRVTFPRKGPDLRPGDDPEDRFSEGPQTQDPAPGHRPATKPSQ